MIDIAEPLKLFDDDVSKLFLVESAKQYWHLPAAFTWTMMERQEPIPTESTYSASIRRKGRRGGPLANGKMVSASKTRKHGACVRCRISPCETAMCGSCVSRGVKQIRINLPPPSAWDRNQAQPLMHGHHRCKQCGTIISEDMTDRLCYVCTCLKLGYLEEHDLLWNGYSGDSAEDAAFMIPLGPSDSEMIFGNAESSPVKNLTFSSDGDTSAFQVDWMDLSAGNVTSPEIRLPISSEIGLRERLIWSDDSPISFGPSLGDISTGYLV
jgi:hypothetical protein